MSYGLGEAVEALRGVRVALGATNLFDKDPPFFNATRGFDVFQYNYFGRVAYVQLDGKF